MGAVASIRICVDFLSLKYLGILLTNVVPIKIEISFIRKDFDRSHFSWVQQIPTLHTHINDHYNPATRITD